MAPGPHDPRLRVLQSFRTPRSTTNPYLVQLRDAVALQAEVETFRWRTALTGRYDVLHLHWPEVVVQRRSRLRQAGAVAGLGIALSVAATRRRAIVRTAHNVAPHERPDWLTRTAIGWCDRTTTWWVRLNDTTPTPPGAWVSTIPHGHYREWFANSPRAVPRRGQLAYVGLIRPYKGVEDLIAAFAGLADPDARLTVAGRPSSATLGGELLRSAATDARVRLDLRHLSDDELVEQVTAAELVVLPYREMHNSGAALLALSLDRPVLVPANDVTRALAAEVGPRWVQLFDGRLDADALAKALEQVRSDPGTAGPDLSARDWSVVGPAHLEVYRRAVAVARGSGTRSPLPAAERVTIAMLTFRRPTDLAVAVPAFLAQAAGSSRTVDLLVVDNDPQGSAREYVMALDDPRVRYVAEPRPGIAAGRNRALAETAGSDLLVFVDDDEVPEPGWLAALLSTHERTGATCVSGAVVSWYEEEPTGWLAAGRFFDRRRLPTGTSIDVAATNNLLIDLRRLAERPVRFDERFGLSGGSDTLFTRTLAAAGEPMVWCDEAVVVDRVPAGRLTRDWVLRRARRSGNSGVRAEVALARGPLGRWRARAVGLCRGTARVAGGSLRVLLGAVTGSQRRDAQGRRSVQRGIGMVQAAFGGVVVEYGRS